MPTITLTVGMNSNVTLAPLPLRARRGFVRNVRRYLAEAGAQVHVDGAVGRGTWQDEATGIIVTETSRTWVADVPDVDTVRNVLPLLCATYEQDAIALTSGATSLVNAA